MGPDAKYRGEIIDILRSIEREFWEDGYWKGYTTGQLHAAQTILRELLTDRFGTLPGLVHRYIEAIADVPRLREAAIRVRHMAAAEDLQL